MRGTAGSDCDQIGKDVAELAKRSRRAALRLALLETPKKNEALKKMAEALRSHEKEIIAANEEDLHAAQEAGRTKALLDRLSLKGSRVEGMARGLIRMADLADPVGEILRAWTCENGIKVRQVRVPLGVIGMIYESRPNVTAEAAGLCLKSGNAVILRGGSEAARSNARVVELISEAARSSGLPADAIQRLPPGDRRGIRALTNSVGQVDLIIARGSEKMIEEVRVHATIPVLGHGRGVCHIYIDQSADAAKAVDIAFNAKAQRPGVCNAMETLLIHGRRLQEVLPTLASKYLKAGVEIRGDKRVKGLIPEAKEATAADWQAEYLDKIISIKVVESFGEAMDHINRYGSGHTDAIVTEDKKAADAFQKQVDSACVMVNASTRLHDGGVFGFGSEIGISTQKLHARGTMGLRELTTTKYLVDGSGQIRE